MIVIVMYNFYKAAFWVVGYNFSLYCILPFCILL